MNKSAIEKFTDDSLLIHSFNHWNLFLHPNQYPYIGRSYAWAKRQDAESVIHMNKAERDELFDSILPIWNSSISELFQHDLTNFAIFANTARHLHGHFIPRYNKPREFHGMEFIDPNPTGNYSPYEKKEIPSSLFEQILSQTRDSIKKFIKP